MLDSQEFTRGLLEPVPLEVMDYFWQQGWSRELLLTLLVRRIDFPDGKSVVNYPDNPDAMKEFHETIEDLLARSLHIESKPATAIGRFLEAEPTLALGELLLAAHAQGLEVRSEDGRYTFLKPPTKKRFVWDLKSSSGCKTLWVSSLAGSDSENVKFYFRSPEGVIYFLGQIMREQAERDREAAKAKKSEKAEKLAQFIPIEADAVNSPSDDKPCSNKSDFSKDLFVAQEKILLGRSLREPAVEVTYRGKIYVIPSDSKESPHYSLSVLTLVGQLIDLNKSRADLPTTGVVTVVGGG